MRRPAGVVCFLAIVASMGSVADAHPKAIHAFVTSAPLKKSVGK